MIPGHDTYWMQQALLNAQRAANTSEVPVGCVIVQGEQLLSEAYNQPIRQHDPSAHAEILALRRAAEVKQNYRLVGTTLYVTLEPCLMCLGAIFHARVSRLVFAAHDLKTGAVESVLSLADDKRLNHHLEVASGVCAEQSAKMLKAFFQSKRKPKS